MPEHHAEDEAERERVSFAYAYKAPGEGGWIDSAGTVGALLAMICGGILMALRAKGAPSRP